MKRITTTLMSTLIAFLLVLSFGFFGPGILSQENRLALVIGNAAYKTSPLRNPVNDAFDMARTLRTLGFEVIHKENAGQRVMEKAIRDFGSRLRKGGVGLFYFAGHGMQINGSNYLIPIGAEIYEETDIKYEAVDAGRILDAMYNAGNSLNIVILDACRDNPFARSFRSSARGLARMDAPTGTLISYSTAPGMVAADGEGRNAVYTKYLLKYITTPGLTIEQVLKKVRVEVIDETGNKQVPWESSSLTGDFYFGSKRAIAVVKRPKKGPKQPVLTTKTKPKDELELALAKLKKKEEAKRKTKEALVQKHKQLLEDVKKCNKINASDLDKGTKLAAWEALKRKYPEWVEGVEPGDSGTFVSRALAEDIDDSFLKLALAEGIRPSITNSIGMKFVYIPLGTFMMGSPPDEPNRDNDESQHRVTISKPFYIQTTEVTQGQWRRVMGNDPSRFKNCGDDCPVENVSWKDVQEFIRKLNQMEGIGRYRLPTEAEWEYACRAGTTTPFYTGTCISTEQANYDGNYPMPGCPRGEDRKKTVRVGSFQPNLWGLYDMHGNVWEWCQVWYGDYPTGQDTDPKGPSSGDSRVLRGGGWYNVARSCRSANRWCFPDCRGTSGFRVAGDF